MDNQHDESGKTIPSMSVLSIIAIIGMIFVGIYCDYHNHSEFNKLAALHQTDILTIIELTAERDQLRVTGQDCVHKFDQVTKTTLDALEETTESQQSK